MSGSAMTDSSPSVVAFEAVEGLRNLLSSGLSIDDPRCQTLIELVQNARSAPALPRGVSSDGEAPVHYPSARADPGISALPQYQASPNPSYYGIPYPSNRDTLSFQQRQRQIISTLHRPQQQLAPVDHASRPPKPSLPLYSPSPAQTFQSSSYHAHPNLPPRPQTRHSIATKAAPVHPYVPPRSHVPQTDGNVLFNSAAVAAAAATMSLEGGLGGGSLNSVELGGMGDSAVFQAKAQINAARKLRRGEEIPEEVLLAARGRERTVGWTKQGDLQRRVFPLAHQMREQEVLDPNEGISRPGVRPRVRRTKPRQELEENNLRVRTGRTVSGKIPDHYGGTLAGTAGESDLLRGVRGAENSYGTQKAQNNRLPPNSLLKYTPAMQNLHESAAQFRQTLIAQRRKELPDYKLVIRERERRIKTRMQGRLLELTNLPMDLPDDVRRRAVIEAKEIKLAELQRQVRGQVTAEMRRLLTSRKSTAELMELAVKMRRPAQPFVSSLPEATLQDVQRLEQKHRLEQKKRSQARQRALLENLMRHSMEFRGVYFEIHSIRKKLHKDLERHFRDKAREEERKRKKAQIDRLKALRSNDEEQYLKLLQNTKNTRLLQLLKQTDEYLIQIGAQVEQQKQNALLEDQEVSGKVPKRNKGKIFTGKLAEKQRPSSPMRSDADTIDALRRRRDEYYTITHSIKEKVHQPSILVGGTLKPYQEDGLSWLISLYNNNLNGILADEMGLGKTIQTIALLAYLIEVKKNHGPFLIIVPLSTLSNWVREFNAWAPSIAKVIYRGDPQTRKRIRTFEIAGGRFNVLLTTYEFIVKDKAVLGRIRWKYIIIDEGHRMKNADSKLALTLGAKYRSRNRLLLTGTPLQNNLTELWALLNFLLPTIFSSAESFETWFNAPFQARALGQSELNEEETLLVISRLHQVLRPFMLRRLKTDVESQLPEKVEAVIRVQMSAWQKALYRQMQNKLGIATATGTSRTFNNMIMQLKKICNHPYLFYTPEAVTSLPKSYLVRASGKFDVLVRALPKLVRTGHRTLIFSQMTHALDYLEQLMQDIGIAHLRLDGTTKAEERHVLLDLFNSEDSNYFCFLLSTRAGGLGLNLQSADTVIIFDSDWNPMMDQQAQDRAHRIGQTKEVRVLRLISANSVEEKILEQANRKLQIDQQVIQAGRFNNKVSDVDRTRILKEILHNQAGGNTSGDDADDNISDVSMINRILARNEEELELFEAMDSEMDELERTGKRKGIMILESELPDWVNAPEVEVKSKEAQEAELLMTHGRGRRERKQVLYDDGLTEEQWTRMVEDGKDIEEEALRRKRLRERSSTEPEGSISGRRGRRRRRRSRTVDSTPAPSPSDSALETETDGGMYGDIKISSLIKRKRKLIVEEESGEDTNANENGYDSSATKRTRRPSMSPSN